MQKVVFDEPYEFVPPYRGRFWSWAVGRYLPRLLRNRFGITGWKCQGLDHLRESLDAGHGIILCPNHTRLSDPLMSGAITTGAKCHAFAMASWHVFKQNWLAAFVCHRVGGFSVYREGLDRKALDTAIGIVATAERPLIIFPEGGISAANDRLMSLMEGTSFVARAAAKKRSKAHPESKVVIHPVAFRYEHRADPQACLSPVVARLERRLFWQTQEQLPLIDRVERIRRALQSTREVQWLGHAKAGDVEQRIADLANLILQTYEAEWLGKTRTGDVIARVKDLRTAILAEMVTNEVDATAKQRRWRQLTDLYYAQSMSLHPKGYLDPNIDPDRLNHRLFETVERLEEELTDNVTLYNDLHVDIRIGEAIDIDPSARRSRGSDPLMVTLRTRMLDLLGIEDQWPPVPVTDC
jgi:1-acyl-sn-glycerol-3-phosphate acyltransferase